MNVWTNGRTKEANDIPSCFDSDKTFVVVWTIYHNVLSAWERIHIFDVLGNEGRYSILIYILDLDFNDLGLEFFLNKTLRYYWESQN